jgi:hypothetical protein
MENLDHNILGRGRAGGGGGWLLSLYLSTA